MTPTPRTAPNLPGPVDGKMRHVPVEFYPWTLKRESTRNSHITEYYLDFFQPFKNANPSSARRSDKSAQEASPAELPFRTLCCREEHSQSRTREVSKLHISGPSCRRHDGGNRLHPPLIPALPGRPSYTPSQAAGSCETLGYLR